MIILNTPHGVYELEIQSNLTMLEYLQMHKIPHNSISIYVENKNGEYENFVGLEEVLDDILASYPSIMIRIDRNIDLISMMSRDQIIEVKKNSELVSEYIFDPINKGSSQILKKFTIDDCKNYVTLNVKKFLEENNIDFSKKLVFGISGGGDSNTLPEAFINAGFPKENIIPVMVRGIPDIDLGISRARLICERIGLELIEVSSEKIDYLLGRHNKEGTWAVDFEKNYPDGDLEIIGTLAVRLGLSYIKEKYNAQACVTGLNLEDILSENLLAILRGELPAAFPVRKIGDITFYYPLYEIPKKILDGCHPKLSVSNYEERFPNNMLWRTVPYYLIQSLSSALPGIEFRLLDGFKKLSKKHISEQRYVFDNDIGFFVEEGIDAETKEMWKQFIESK